MPKNAIIALVILFALGLALTVRPTNHAWDCCIMPPAQGAVNAGRFEMDNRPDLFVPLPTALDYTPPQNLLSLAELRQTIGQEWYLYPKTLIVAPKAIVLLFHGGRRTGLSMIDMWKDVADRHGLILAAPNGNDGDWPTRGGNVEPLVQIVTELSTPYSPNGIPVFLFGHSNGAIYAQRLLNQTQGPWRAAALHAGYDNSDSTIAPATPKPIRFYVGTREHLFRPERTKVIAEHLTTLGHPVSLQIIPEHTHWLYAAGPRIASDAWDWLQSY